MDHSKKNIAVIYHADCPDGFGAAYAAWKKFGNSANYYAMHHGDAPLKLKGKKVYFLDIIYKDEEALKKLISENRQVTAIDHHVSTKSLVESTTDFRYAQNHSGAVLSWRYFHPGKPVPLALQYIEDMDLWRLAFKHSMEVRLSLALLPYDFKAWDLFVGKIKKAGLRKKIVEGGALLKRYQEQVTQRLIAEYAEKVNFAGHEVYAINSPFWSDELGHGLYEKYPPFAIVWREYRGLLRVSMRGNGKVDLTKIAGKFGGGGHHDAAGFTRAISKGFPWKPIKKRS
jgi:uncharacterized protein